MTPNDLSPLLQRVYAAPDDDEVRQVFADALLAKGDPRGELIRLQLLRAGGRATVEQVAREQELLADAKRLKKWTAPLSSAGTVKLERGFPAAVDLAARKKVVPEAAWATVREITGLLEVKPAIAAQLLDHPATAQVRKVSAIDHELLEALGERERSWSDVSFQTVVPTPEQAARFPRIERLQLRQEGWVSPQLFGRLSALRRLFITGLEPAPGHFEQCPELVELGLFGTVAPIDPEAIRPLKKLERLQLGQLPERPLPPNRVRRVELGKCTGTEIRRLAAEVPHLEELTVHTGDADELFSAANEVHLKLLRTHPWLAFENLGTPELTAAYSWAPELDEFVRFLEEQRWLDGARLRLRAARGGVVPAAVVARLRRKFSGGLTADDDSSPDPLVTAWFEEVAKIEALTGG